MTNLEKCNAGIEYSYADEELIDLKTEAIRQCEIFKTFLITLWWVVCQRGLLRQLRMTFE